MATFANPFDDSKLNESIFGEDQSWAPSITTTVRKKGALSTSPWRPAHALDSFVSLVSAKRFPAKN